MAEPISVTDFIAGFSSVLKIVLNQGETYSIVKYGTPVATFGPSGLSKESDSIKVALDLATELRDDAIRTNNLKAAEAIDYFIDEFKDKIGVE